MLHTGIQTHTIQHNTSLQPHHHDPSYSFTLQYMTRRDPSHDLSRPATTRCNIFRCLSKNHLSPTHNSPLPIRNTGLGEGRSRKADWSVRGSVPSAFFSVVY